MIPVNPNFMPNLNVPVRLCPELVHDVGDKVDGMMSYEVLGKDENGVHLQIKHIAPSVKLRKLNVH